MDRNHQGRAKRLRVLRLQYKKKKKQGTTPEQVEQYRERYRKRYVSLCVRFVEDVKSFKATIAENEKAIESRTKTICQQRDTIDELNKRVKMLEEKNLNQ